MERIKRIRNPFQDKINALNLKDIEEGLKTDSYLKKSHDPIPNDINDERFPMTDILPPNVLKPEELSMKDLLDQIQIQTILNNNIAPFVEKKIKSEVTQAMIKDFQNEIAKPVEINGTFYKFQPPDLSIDLNQVPPDFPDEVDYQANIYALIRQELNYQNDLSTQYVRITGIMRTLEGQVNDGSLSVEEYRRAGAYYGPIFNKLKEAESQSKLKVASLEQDYRNYDTNKTEYNAKSDVIKKANAAALKAYEDELKARNSGFEIGQQPDETDEDYAQRLIDTAQTTVDPASVELQAKRYAFTSLKDRLDEVMPPYKSEAVLNAIIAVGGHEKLQPIKDQWPGLKKKLEEVFGDVSKVENTDSIAQILYNFSLKPTVRPSQGPTITATAPTTPSPNIIPLPTSIVPTKPTTQFSKLPVRYNAPTGQLIDTTFPVPFQQELPLKAAEIQNIRAQRQQAQADYEAYQAQEQKAQKKEDLYNRALLRKEQLLSNLSAKKERERLKAAQKRGQLITSIDFALEPTDRFYPTEIVPYGSASQRINMLLKPPLESVGTRPIYPRPQQKQAYEDELRALYETYPEELGVRPPPATRSKSLEERLAGKTGRQEIQMTPRELRDILESNGLPVSRLKKENYDTVKEAGLLPPKVNLISREDFEALGQSRMAQYLEDNQLVGIHGGVPVSKSGTPKPTGVLLAIFDRYKLTGSGFKSSGNTPNIKTQFAIIEGEIKAGNNNPQLIRDARKMLKEMVMNKLVTIYEAQSHLKYLRSLNKI